MCLAVLALDAHPRYALVLAANRDEHHGRPTAPAAWWREGWLAGRDLSAGGAWLGVDRRGRWALVTNVRDPSRIKPAAPSRGALVTSILADAGPVEDAISRILETASMYNGFNLVAGRIAQAAWGSNYGIGTATLRAGVHGLSNAMLDTPWPKVVRTKDALRDWCVRAEHDLGPVFAILRDVRRAEDHELPSTGISLERERRLSSPFIVSDEYGTRCSTVIAIDRDGRATFIERSFDARGELTGSVEERFALAA